LNAPDTDFFRAIGAVPNGGSVPETPRPNSETRFQILRALSQNPEMTQRELAGELGISLGKTNYCLRALVDKGLIKAANFRRSQHKARYFYQLTPRGITEKAGLTKRFLQRKLEEHEALTQEIQRLREEIAG
jgi:EPS-associated MarR family transcriptional regulator